MNRPGTLSPPERKLVVGVGDVVLLIGSVVAALWRRAIWSDAEFTTAFAIEFVEMFLLVLAWVVGLAAMGAYELAIASSARLALRAVVATAGVVLGLYLIAYFFAPREALQRSVVLLQVALAAGSVGVWRLLIASVLAGTRFRRRVLVLSAGRSGVEILATLLARGTPTFEVVGVLEDETGIDNAPLKYDYKVVGTTKDLVGAADRYGVSEIVVAVDETLSVELLESFLVLQEQGIQITPMPVMHEALTGQVPVQHLGSNWWGTLPLDHPQTRALYSLAKRALDLAIAIPSLVIFAILLTLLAAAIKLDSKGPVFYRQRRVGKHGRPFLMVKLRTMIVDAEPEGRPVWAAHRDPRITRVGRLLRATMLDEIPQLWNVVKGEMSIVGPRPERPELIAELETKIPYYRLRHAAAPGMAGWSLLHEGYSGTAEKALTKLQYDLYYIKHQSLWLDLQIILRTLGRGLTFRRSERKMEEPGAVR